MIGACPLIASSTLNGYRTMTALTKKAATALILSLICFHVPSAGAAPKKPLAQRMVDWYTLLESFALSAGSDATGQTWDARTEPGSPVAWVTDGIETRKGCEIFCRDGEVIVTVNGRPTKVLRQTWQNAPWNITLAGPRAGVDKIELSPSVMDDRFDLIGDLQERNIPVRVIACDEENRNSGGTVLAKVSPAGKRPFWLLSEWSCGAQFCTNQVTMFFSLPTASDFRGMPVKCTTKSGQ